MCRFGVTLSEKNILNLQNCVTLKHIKTYSFYQDISNDVEDQVLIGTMYV